MIDVWSYRIVVFALCLISSSVVGGISLASQDKKMPQELTALASGCVGALTGLLVPSLRRSE